MAFGKKAGSIEEIRKTLSEGIGDGTYIRGVPPDGLTVRFLQEPTEWFTFYEHFDETQKRYYPCSGDRCVGCRIPNQQGKMSRGSLRYLTNALNVDNEQVFPLKLARTLADRLVARYERRGTLVDRDFSLIRAGEGLKTEYDADPLDPFDRKLDQYEDDLHDLEEILQAAWDSVWAEPKDEVRSSPFKTTKQSRQDDDDDEGFYNPEDKKARAAAKRSEARKSVAEDDDKEEDGSVTFTEDELTEMTLGQLRSLATDMDIPFDRSTKKAVIVELVLEQQ